MKTLRGADSAPLTPLLGRTVAVLGFGNQGHAHALNLRDSGIRVVIGARPNSNSASEARDRRFDVAPLADAAAGADLVIMAIGDQAQPEIYREHVAPRIKPGATLGFLHGFSIRYRLIEPRADIGVVMVAPKGPGVLLRERYAQGRGLPCLLAVHQEPSGAAPAGHAESIALAWAGGIGAARAAIIYTTFADETETDLFGEQAVLCGGLGALIVAAFEILVEQGYPPELAYLECCHEVKQIADLIYDRGLAGMREAISGTAEFGAYHAGPRLIDASVRTRLRALLGDIRDGEFARAMRQDGAAGSTWLLNQRRDAAAHAIEAAGRAVRAIAGGTTDAPPGVKS